MSVQIDSQKLKTVRKARKIGRPKLAKLSGLTERQIARLESSDPIVIAPSNSAVARIAEVLQVPVGALTGELGLIDDDLTPASEKKCGCCS